MSTSTNSQGKFELSPGQLDPGSSRKDLVRQRSGLAAGVLLGLIVFFIMPSDLPYELRATAGSAVLIAVWWMTEAIPLAATALMPLVLFPALGLAEIGDFSGNYAQPTIFLFMGGFMLAMAMQRWNLHKRIALWVLSLMGSSTKMLVLGFMIATGFLSMWVSNTATAVMMLPIGVSVLVMIRKVVKEDREGESADDVTEENTDPGSSKFGIALMLGIAYAASIGSLGTIIGTPPNTMLVAYLSDAHDINIGFGQWMLFGVPIAVVLMLIAWVLLTMVLFKPEVTTVPGGRQLMVQERKNLGRMSTGEVRVLLVFVIAAFSWIFVPVIWEDTMIADAVIAMMVGVALFIIPGGPDGVKLLTWDDALGLPWGVLLLFGGGLALSSQLSASGVSEWIGEQMSTVGTLPLFLIIGAVAMVVLILTEFTSNTATAATFLPLAGGVALAIGIDPMLLAIPVALAATSAFMMPVATPPNAIAYGSGYVTMNSMLKAGLWLNVAALIVITLATYFMVGAIFGIEY